MLREMGEGGEQAGAQQMQAMRVWRHHAQFGLGQLRGVQAFRFPFMHCPCISSHWLQSAAWPPCRQTTPPAPGC